MAVRRNGTQIELFGQAPELLHSPFLRGTQQIGFASCAPFALRKIPFRIAKSQPKFCLIERGLSPQPAATVHMHVWLGGGYVAGRWPD